MKISICSKRTLLTPCELDSFDYQLDPYIGCGHYCYYCYVLKQAETDWRQEIKIHRNIGEQLDVELNEITPQTIYIGYHTDPYQPCEADSKQTRRVIEVLQANGFSASILTKSDLILRDLDILKEMSAASVSLTVSFNNCQTRGIFEENTIETSRRVEALKKIKQAGVHTGALLCPVVPYITETIELLEEISDYADTIWIYGMSANKNDPSDTGWNNTKQILLQHFPDIAKLVESAIHSKDHHYWTQIRDEISTFNQARQLDLRVHI